MLHTARDKEWANSLVWRDRVESFTPQLSEGNICVLANERCLLGDGAIGSLQPSEVTASVTVQGKSEIEMKGKEGRGGNPCIESSCRNREGKSSFYGLVTLPLPAMQYLRYCGLHTCLEHFKAATSYN